MERGLIEDYVALLEEIVANLQPHNHAEAVALASVPDEIRGYGHVKEHNLTTARAMQAERLSAFRRARADEEMKRRA
jgi:indolepyruvate ferredoxin oxidoreductase